MNTKHRKTLIAIYKNPAPKQLEWKAVEALLVAVGAQVIEGGGSRVRFHERRWGNFDFSQTASEEGSKAVSSERRKRFSVQDRS